MERRHALAWVLALGLLPAACVGPSDRRPGLHLSGDEVERLPDDWGFTAAHREIALEVHTPYLLPHSVTIWCAAVDGALYVGARDPQTKSWPGWVDRDPDVRLRIGEHVYPVRLTPVEDEARLAAVRRAYAEKYALPPPGPDAPPVRYWWVGSRG